MRMAWWIFIVLVAIQAILLQYMIESYFAGHYDTMPYYGLALGFMFLLTWVTHVFFRRIEETRD